MIWRLRLAVFAALALFAALWAGTALAEGEQHIVTPGETLSQIALVYGVGTDALAEINDIVNPDLIGVGQRLNIPGLPSPAPSAHEPSAAGPTTYTVEAGDTLSGIAEAQGASVTALQGANGIADGDYIFEGQTLVIPAAASSSPDLTMPWLPSERPHDSYVEGIIDEVAAEEGVDANWVRSIAWVESSWDQSSVSSTGAVGLMQVMPGTEAWLEEGVFGYDLDAEGSAYDNVKAGARLLRILLLANGGNIDLALGSYYQGQGATDAGLWYDDTAGYIFMIRTTKMALFP